MNSLPIALRLASGSVTPASRSRNRSAALTWTRLTLKSRRKVSETCSASPWRSSPVSTNTQVSLSPTARWTSRAATEESTPPDRAHSTWPSPTRARTAASCSSMIETLVQLGRQPAASYRKFLNRSMPRSVWATSGWNWTPYRPRSGSSNPATGEASVLATTLAPGGGAVMVSPWLIQTTWVPGRSPNSRLPSGWARRVVRPYSLTPVASTRPPRTWAMACWP